MPRSSPATAAERMRRFRARMRAAGLVERHVWEPRDAAERWSDHRIAEIRSLAMHALIARKVARDPAIIVQARANLDRWAAQADPRASWVGEWRDILQRPAEQVAAFLASTSDDAFRLRQSSPFAGALTDGEREAILAAFRDRL